MLMWCENIEDYIHRGKWILAGNEWWRQSEWSDHVYIFDHLQKWNDVVEEQEWAFDHC